MAAKQEVSSITTYIYASRLIFSPIEFNRHLFHILGIQEVPSITTDIAANQLLLCLCRFWYVKNSMAPFILWLGDPIWPPIL